MKKEKKKTEKKDSNQKIDSKDLQARLAETYDKMDDATDDAITRSFEDDPEDEADWKEVERRIAEKEAKRKQAKK